MEQMVEVTMDGFLDTLNQMRDRFECSEPVWDLFVHMVTNEMIDLSVGPADVMHMFMRDAEVVEKKDFERNFPKYSEIMTWEEFVNNECMCGNDEAAVVGLG